MSWPSTKAAAPERLVSFTPDDLYIVPDFAWSQDSETLAFQQLNREQNELQLRVLAVPESPTGLLGGPRTVLTERSPTWVNPSPAPRFLKDNRRFVWVSERDGFAHVYLCELAGSCRAVTQGPWTVDAVVHLRFDGRAPSRRGKNRLRLLHRHREGCPRAASLPRAPRRNRTGSVDP